MVQSSVLQVSFLPTSVDEGIERKKLNLYSAVQGHIKKIHMCPRVL